MPYHLLPTQILLRFSAKHFNPKWSLRYYIEIKSKFNIRKIMLAISKLKSFFDKYFPPSLSMFIMNFAFLLTTSFLSFLSYGAISIKYVPVSPLPENLPPLQITCNNPSYFVLQSLTPGLEQWFFNFCIINFSLFQYMQMLSKEIGEWQST